MRTPAPAALVLAFALGLPTLADTANLTAVRDNTLYETGLTDPEQTSNGAGQFFFAARTGAAGGNTVRRGLVLFDLSSIPSNAIVSSATLTLRCSKSVSGAVPIDVHRALADWGEGTSDGGFNEGAGAPATPNDATWVYRTFNTAAWATPGGDFSPTVSASTPVSGVAVYNWSGPQLTADVQAWVASPASNFGWLLKGGEATPQTAKRFDGKSGLAANAPKLLVEFSIPAVNGACCNGTSCSVGTAAACTGGGGMYQGDSTMCGPPGNPTTCCKANFNGTGNVTVQDLFDYLAAWFAKCGDNGAVPPPGAPCFGRSADVNGSNTVTVQDLFDFLALWFAKCPG